MDVREKRIYILVSFSAELVCLGHPKCVRHFGRCADLEL
jgi:hypothetical protein